MPIPSEETVADLVVDLIEQRGLDLEGVQISRAGKLSTVRVLVDGENGVSLDQIATLSNEVSAKLDEVDEFGTLPYTLEVTTPGTDRPLELERHWRRARGRKVEVATATETIEGRIGRLDAGSVDIVVRGKSGPTVRAVQLDDVVRAVVQVEFSRPNARELELTGGVAQGRPAPGAAPVAIEQEGTEE
ncbi:ribosome maturation factor RimP [Aldersonia sp. NBC_00410]|uniref:ribosome maturation factor RimP n=1 Tax=Aldersonia sp. NBC_00410 TaxID=2975954 RepID=UPI002257E530|nr:ribosome maturation factor RimP [Aldersonia sp. NBC_00410]MCX5046550.1 ribosome maturation factor RimP [Aldersonia sp. NBC_00410]